jgi:hypothetical protein
MPNIVCSRNQFFPLQGMWFAILIGVYYRMLKINHDTHELVPDFYIY